MALLDEQFAFLKDVRRLLDQAEALGFEVSGGELGRSLEAQSALVRSGQEKSMDSPHLRRCAIVLNLFKADGDRWRLVQSAAELDELGRHWEQLDPRNVWGGREGGALDLGRFERSPGGWPSKAVARLDMPEVSLPPAEAVALADPDRPAAVVFTDPPPPTHPVLRRGSSDRGGVMLLQELLVKAGRLDKSEASGSFDQTTEAVVKKFQAEKTLVADGVVGEKTWVTLMSLASATRSEQAVDPSARYVGDDDFQRVADALAIEVATVKAVYKVESNGKGFVGDRPKILFEGHVFWDRLQRKGRNPAQLAVGRESILYPRWTKEHYAGGAGEFKRLELAETIDQAAARESASWGLFQIMGYHWQFLGYPSIDDFVARMEESEANQLQAFGTFISKRKSPKGGTLRDLLEKKDWAGFAFSYNGAEYRKNAYDDKLRDQYRKFTTSA